MRMPGFDADASVYETSRSYAVRQGGDASAGRARVVPQARKRCQLGCLGAYLGRTLGCTGDGFCQFYADAMYDACMQNCSFY
jgi:hypothetical protein